nr:inositol hexakisphosphate and diphosphoinositol-pentakisphosphate kinase 1-like [Ipomoea batatas]
MEFFNTAKAVRLKSHLDKFLVADEDQRSVRQGRNCSSNKVYWTVELVEGSYHLIRLKSSHGGYLSASDEPFLLGMTGKRVLQALPNPGSGMEFFYKAKAVRLESHLGKYLVGDDDEESVRQSRSGASLNARWTVEFVEGKDNVIRLKSCHGLYLTAAEEPFLLGMTGKKVVQTLPTNKTHAPSIEWEPIKEGFRVKLRTAEGKYLRANGATPPWRNSVTHDLPNRTATQDWVLWGVDVVDIVVSSDGSDSPASCLSPPSSFNSVLDDTGTPPTRRPHMKTWLFVVFDQNPGGNSNIMEFFKKAKSVRLKSHHDKYLLADSDKESVFQDRSGTRKSAKWTVEFVEGFDNVIRLKSCYGKYLTAMDEQFLLGVTGRRVRQTTPKKLDSKLEWEPIIEDSRGRRGVKLKTRYGNYLRANGGLPPWRNSITHDIPHRHQNWILWEVDVVETLPESPKKVPRSEDGDDDLTDFRLSSSTLRRSASESFASSQGGRLIYYYVADDRGKVNDAVEGQSFQFKGHCLEQLTEKLEELTGLESIIVCLRNPFTGKFSPLRLALPPNNATMHIVVLPPTSRAAREFMPESAPR